jgi:MoxR-like ATPase
MTTHSLNYQPLIDWLTDDPLTANDPSALEAPDRRDGRIYHYDDRLHLAVELALATGRPLLLRGDPGSGKSSLAAYVARNLGYRYYEHTVTSQTNAQDLLWRFDLVRRLADAQARAGLTNPPPLNDYDYVEPGVLWWVFNRETALTRGWSSEPGAGNPPSKRATEPNEEVNKDRRLDAAVVLIDELDKADPDVPNALLVPLGSLKFDVTDISLTVTRTASAERPGDNPNVSRLLIVITTNEEKELPAAFLRRCIVHKLDHPDAERLVTIAKMHFARPPARDFSERDEQLARALALRVARLRAARQEIGRRPPGTAEYLDALRACLPLGIAVDNSAAWKAVERATLVKDDTDPPEDAATAANPPASQDATAV